MDKTKQIRILYAMIGRLNKSGVCITKDDLVFEVSGGQTTHLGKLSDGQFMELFNHVRGILTSFGGADAGDRKRKRVISHLKEAGYVLANGRADMAAIEAWAQKQKHGKRLNAHNLAELSDLIYAADKVRQHYLSKV
ncbi:MAG TPA: hypothetical protein VLH56_16850 [Dissulfurispiraceae bacterium]|nr:hypothetical protein [Dissulfurispiraceae bacterium]